MRQIDRRMTALNVEDEKSLARAVAALAEERPAGEAEATV